MATDVMEDPNLILLIAQQEQGPTGQGHRNDVARLPQFVREADEDPGSGKQPGGFQTIVLVARVGEGRQAAAQRAVLSKGCEIGHLIQLHGLRG